MLKYIKTSLNEAQSALDNLLADKTALFAIESAAKILINTFQNGGHLICCGNGGSMCDAMHFAEELTGRYRKDRKGFPAISISDPSHISCVANDFGYDHIFSRYVESHGRSGDVLLAISTSGKSINILNAVQSAKNLDMKVIALTGQLDSPLESICDLCICTVGGQFCDRIQELHIKVLHILIELIERHFYPENYE
ncbi:D-sedoheptulose 7-phosphate isomerase [bacterium]|nr:D-sedoheptulose 7-phosphate isomerase [bacterium]RQV98658.1 MAG: D-sedoheptulose 7-phosphate isomerase [bacterium]